MNLLTIDVGNTNIVLGLFHQKTLKRRWRIPSEAKSLKKIAGKIPSVDGICIASVVPSLIPHLRKFSKELGHSPLFITGRSQFPFKIALPHPSQVGADRLVNMVVAFHEWKPPLIVIDIGTATTVDVMDRHGIYQGGLILPGPQLMMEALAQRCARLSLVPLSQPKRIIGKLTREAIQSGAFYGTIGLIEGLIQKIKKQLGKKPTVIMTGGFSTVLGPYLKGIKKIDPDLTLKGLQILYETFLFPGR